MPRSRSLVLAAAAAVVSTAALVQAKAATVPQSGDSPAQASSTTLLNVRFSGAFDGNTYRAAPGEIVSGALTRNSGSEAITDGAVGLTGDTAGLTFTPAAGLTTGDAVTQSVAVEAVIKASPTGNNGFNTLLSLAGGAYYRFRNGSPAVNEYGMNGPEPPYPTVSGIARAVSDTGYDHITLVYTYVSMQQSELASYVDGCQVGETLVNGVPAEAAVNAVGFGNEVNQGGRHRGFLGALQSVAVSSFTPRRRRAERQVAVVPLQPRRLQRLLPQPAL
jgi:hypothetical protein